MHAGRLDRPTAAARVYSVLTSPYGQWVGGWELQGRAQTTAVSTRVSEVRHQLPADERIEMEQRGRSFYYRIVKVGAEQLVLV